MPKSKTNIVTKIFYSLKMFMKHKSTNEDTILRNKLDYHSILGIASTNKTVNNNSTVVFNYNRLTYENAAVYLNDEQRHQIKKMCQSETEIQNLTRLFIAFLMAHHPYLDVKGNLLEELYKAIKE